MIRTLERNFIRSGFALGSNDLEDISESSMGGTGFTSCHAVLMPDELSNIRDVIGLSGAAIKT